MTILRIPHFVGAILVLLVCSGISSGNNQKSRIAVLSPSVSDSLSDNATGLISRRFGISAQGVVNTGNVLLDALEDSILATGKFDLVTRDKSELEALIKELEFSTAAVTAGDGPEKTLLQAADYLVIPTINDFYFYRSITAVPNIKNKYWRQDHGKMSVNIDILEVETGQKKAAFRLSDSFSTQKSVVNTKKGEPSSSYFTKMSESIAAELADDLLDTVFPMLIINISGDSVWINRGQDGGLREGDILSVFKPGARLIDPYTNAVLGTAEEYIAELKVTRVNPKFTVGSISEVDGLLKSKIETGDILRKP